MKRSPFQFTLTKFLLPCLLIILIAESASAALVRGRIDRNGKPVPGVTVVIIDHGGRSSPAVRSGNDGMYYLSVPPGAYVLQINVPGPAPMRFQVQVHDPVTDVAPISIR